MMTAMFSKNPEKCFFMSRYNKVSISKVYLKINSGEIPWLLHKIPWLSEFYKNSLTFPWLFKFPWLFPWRWQPWGGRCLLDSVRGVGQITLSFPLSPWLVRIPPPTLLLMTNTSPHCTTIWQLIVELNIAHLMHLERVSGRRKSVGFFLCGSK